MRCLSLMKGVMWVWAGGPQERSLGTRGSYLGSTKRLNTWEILCLTNLRPLPEILKQNLRDMDPNCTPFKGTHVILLQASACCTAPFFFFFTQKTCKTPAQPLLWNWGVGFYQKMVLPASSHMNPRVGSRHPLLWLSVTTVIHGELAVTAWQITPYLVTQNNWHLLSCSSCGSGVWRQLSWVILA